MTSFFKPLSYAIIIMLGLQSLASTACTTIIVGKCASANGKIIIARTSDTIDARRAKNFHIYRDIQGEKLYTGLPYADLELDPNFDMAQVTTNRFGVSVSATETIQSAPKALQLDRPVFLPYDGVSEPNIPSIVMPRAKTAEEAVHILGQAIETRGVYSKKGFGVLFADHQHVWYLETLSGHQWVAIEIPEDVYFVASNGPGQIQEYLPKAYTYAMSHYKGLTPIEFAKQNNIAVEPHGIFNFRSTFADIHNPKNRNANYVRLAYLQHYFNPSSMNFDDSALDKGEYPMFLKPEHLIQIEDIKTLQASHYQDFPTFDPYTRSDKNEKIQPYYYPIANVRTSNGHITVVGNPLNDHDNSIANLEYIALGMPTVSIYIPMYFGLKTTPSQLTGASSVADNKTLFWEFRKLQTLVFLSSPEKNIPFEFASRINKVKTNYQWLTTEITKKQQTLEREYEKSHDPALIDAFNHEILIEISRVNRKMIGEFMDELDIDKRYGLKNDTVRNQWFTDTIRKQDCDYRADKCETLQKNAAAVASTYIDEPIL